MKIPSRFLLQLVPWPGFNEPGVGAEKREERKIFCCSPTLVRAQGNFTTWQWNLSPNEIDENHNEKPLDWKDWPYLAVPGPTTDDEEMEVHFNQAVDTPDPPPASPTNSPNQEDTTQGETGYAVVLDMVQNLRDKLSALNLDNTNIRAACEALRRQCHSQGVAFGDLSQLVKQSLEGRQFQQPREETGHHILLSGQTSLTVGVISAPQS